MLFQVLNFQQEFWGALTDFFTLLCNDASPHSKIYQLCSKLADRGLLVVSFDKSLSKCRISRNGISRYLSSCVCPLVSDKISIAFHLSFLFHPLLFPVIFLSQATPWNVTFARIRRAIRISVSILLKPASRDRILVSRISDGAVSLVFCILHAVFFLRLCELSLKHILFICIF